jgi:uracil-DNA glycosylase family 4
MEDVQACTLCTRMCQSRRVLSDFNGDWNARVLFVAEAPGRLGAEKTGIPLFGDRTGDRFEELLKKMRFSRSEVFISNAILCNPRDEKGNNDSPSVKEIRNCSAFLKRTIEAVSPDVVVALGRIALNALALVWPHALDLKESVGTISAWNRYKLGVLYHPGPRAGIHRSWDVQLKDATRLAAAIRKFLD